MAATEILTIGHSNLALEDFLARVQAHEIALVVDVRRYPVSRRHPHFGRGRLEAALAQVGVGYRHDEDLGGRREAAASSPNPGLEDPIFRAYADHMRTAPFQAALRRLIDLSGARRTAVLCAEADPSRCHRRLLSDALTLQDVAVRHALDERRSQPHELHPAARLDPLGVPRYPASGPRQAELF